MQDPEALGGLSHQGGVDYRGEENDGAFIAPENLNVASATQHVLKSGGTFIVNDLYLALRAVLGGPGQGAGAGEPPHDDRAGQPGRQLLAEPQHLDAMASALMPFIATGKAQSLQNRENRLKVIP